MYFTKVSSILVTAHARQASLETVLIHYADQEVSSVTGVNVNRLDTYNVAVKELNLFYHEIDVLEQFAKLQTSLSRSFSSSQILIPASKRRWRPMKRYQQL